MVSKHYKKVWIAVVCVEPGFSNTVTVYFAMSTVAGL